SSCDDPAIRLKSRGARLVKVMIAEVRAHFSGAAKRSVDRSVAQVTRQGEVIEVSGVFSGTDGDDFGIRLDENGIYIVVEPIEIGRDLPPAAEGRVECSVRIVTGEREVGIRRVFAGEINEVGPRGDDLAIGLQGHRKGVTALPGKTGCDDAAAAEAGIERAVRIVTHHFEVAEKGKLRKGAT